MEDPCPFPDMKLGFCSLCKIVDLSETGIRNFVTYSRLKMQTSLVRTRGIVEKNCRGSIYIVSHLDSSIYNRGGYPA